MLFTRFSAVLALVLSFTTVAVAQTGTKMVFAHLVVGTTSDRASAADWDADMQRAKAMGIDAFALDIGTDSFTDTQLGYAYQSAANNGMKVFISFDFNYWNAGSQASAVGAKIKQYSGYAGQLIVDGKVFASSFVGDALDIPTMRAAASGITIFWAPNIHPGTSFANVDGALSWLAWDNNGNNKAPTASANYSVSQGDQSYLNALAGKPYIAPASPWFFTHFGPEVSYSKNWVFPGDLLWYNRWTNLLTLGSRFIEIITWNDYGESHYVGPLSSKHYDDGSSKWANDMPHDAWLDMAVPYISAFKAGATSVNNYIQQEQIFYWYRPMSKKVNCDSTDSCNAPANNPNGDYVQGKPQGYDTLADSVFVVTFLKSAATLTVSSGGLRQSFNAPAGASSFTAVMAAGQQIFTLTRNGITVMMDKSLRDIQSACPCGIYNFNAYVGKINCQAVPSADSLGPDGLVSFTVGLHVSTCSATPSLASPTQATCANSAAATTASTSTTTTTTKATTVSSTTKAAVATTTNTTTTTTRPTTTTATTTKTCGRTITASSQIAPTNCLQAGDVWQGPAGQTTPDRCDGAGTCTQST